MSDTNRRLSADDIEALLPWYAAGTLVARDAAQVEAALAADAGLARRLDLVREEMTGTVVLNEDLGVPSARAAQKLFAAIDRERLPARADAAGGGWLDWLAHAMSPRAYAIAGGMAALLIVAQAGIIAKIALQDRSQQGGGFTTQSMPPEGGRTSAPPALEIAFMQVQFAPQASMADVNSFLRERNAAIIAGPHRDGHYRIRVYARKDELDRMVREFQSAGNLVTSATLTAD